jgi:hypothetical protein
MASDLLMKSKDAVVDALSQATDTLGLGSTPPPPPPDLPAAAKQAVYVDESLTADQQLATPPTGARDAPFASAVSALVALGQDITLFVKKAPSAAAPASAAAGSSSDAAAPDFEPITSSGLKKALKLSAAERKKLDKALAGKAEADRASEEARVRDERKRKEAAEVVLVEDEGLPKAVKVRSPMSSPA